MMFKDLLRNSRFSSGAAALVVAGGVVSFLACDTSRLASPPGAQADLSAPLAALTIKTEIAAEGETRGGEDPPGCSFASSGASIQANPSGLVQVGDEICYRVCYSVPNGAIDSCNVTNFSADLFFPDEVANVRSVPVVIDADIERGTTFCCGGVGDTDPRCNAALTPGPGGDYCYTVNSADEVTSFVGCPPTPSGTVGRVVAYTMGLGDSLTPIGDTVAPCAAISNQVARCGDDAVNQPSERCDGADAGTLGCSAAGSGQPDACRGDCTCCGDGIEDPGEECDDGNDVSGDGCEPDCTITVIECGDNEVNQPSETCDGTDAGTNGCSAAGSGEPDECRPADSQNDPCTCCGDGVLHEDSGETCDGSEFSTNGDLGRPCRTDCTFCGDGIVQPGEDCDDGNNVDDDDCPNDCRVRSDEICRTPGFWGTHACGDAGGLSGCEKSASRNVTQLAINSCGGCLNVCGDIIDSTALNDSDSALEAMCVAPTGVSIRQLARQLTAAALNCCVSGSDDSCDGISVNDVFDACNDACSNGATTADLGGGSFNCIDAIDCFNNGGVFDQDLDGVCQTGACWDNGAPCNEADTHLCGDINTNGPTCVPLTGTCHDANFGLCADGTLCSDLAECADGSSCAPGPAGSSKACNKAIGNACYVVGTTDCAGSDDSNAPEDCP